MYDMISVSAAFLHLQFTEIIHCLMRHANKGIPFRYCPNLIANMIHNETVILKRSPNFKIIAK